MHARDSSQCRTALSRIVFSESVVLVRRLVNVRQTPRGMGNYPSRAKHRFAPVDCHRSDAILF